MTDAGFKQCRQTLHSGLGCAVDQGVATTEISLQRMLNTTAIPQRDDVLLKGTTAIGVVLSIGDESAEHTVIHVNSGMC